MNFTTELIAMKVVSSSLKDRTGGGGGGLGGDLEGLVGDWGGVNLSTT